MKNLRVVLGTCVLALCFVNTATAGEILAPGIMAPPPPPPAQSSAVAGTGPLQSGVEPSLFDAVLSGTLAAIEYFALLIP